MPLQDITITASINSLVTQSYGQRTYIASSDDQSFPLEAITGSYAGAWPDFTPRSLTSANSSSNTTTGLFVNITQSWSESIVTPLGIVSYIHNTMEEFINGEFSGSIYTVSNGSLNDTQCEQFLNVNTTLVSYDLTVYSSLGNFLAASPPSGEFYAYEKTTIIQTGGGPIDYYSLTLLKVAKIDNQGNDNTLSLQELTKIKWTDSVIGKVLLTITNIREYPDYYLYEVIGSPFTTSNFTPATYNTNLEPYLTSTFKNSDCDVLINNANQNNISQYRRRVLYDNGSTIPSNIEQIIDGTAEYAEINDYLFNANASVLPRYLGVRENQAFLNIWTPGDTGPSKSPSVTNQQTYFAYFDYLQNTTAEFLDKSVAHIIYLFDENGVVQTPTLTGSYYYNLIDNFISDQNANIIIEATSGERTYIGNKKIIRPGVIPRAILYSQTGSGYNVQTDILIGENYPTSAPIPNYYSKYSVAVPNQTIGTNNNLVVDINFIQVPSPNMTLNAGPSSIEVMTDTNLTKITFGLYISYQTQYIGTTPIQLNISWDNTVFFEKSEDGGANWFELSRTTIRTSGIIPAFQQNSSPQTTEWTVPLYEIPVASNQYRFRWSNPADTLRVVLLPSTYVMVNQYPPAFTATASLAGNYWYTGSNLTTGLPKNILTSPQLAFLYNENNPVTQRFNPDAGYGPNLPFSIKPYDQIRFEGDESQVYTILKAELGYLNFINSNFDAPGWSTSNPSWTTDLFTATSDGSALAALTSPSWTEPLSTGNTYYVTFTVSNFIAPGGISFYGFGGNLLTGSLLNGNGTYTWGFETSVGAETQIVIYNGPTSGATTNLFTGSISNISVTGVSGSLNLTLDKNVVDGTEVNSFLIRRLNPHPNYVLLDTQMVSGSGFLLAEFTTNKLQQNFDNIIIDAKERGLY